MLVSNHDHQLQGQQGNVLFLILIGVVLLGALTFTISRGQQGQHGISKEKLIVFAAETVQYGGELKQALQTVLDTGISEADISFAHGDAPSQYGDEAVDPDSTEIFSYNGGKAEYKSPNPEISTATYWEFYGESAMPQVGSSRADLIAVLPDVTREFCDAFNTYVDLDISATYPDDPATCFKSADANRFNGSFNASPNTLDTSTFSALPAPMGCASCGSNYHAYIVLYER